MPVLVSPSSGSGLEQTFTLIYSDSSGANDLTNVWAWFLAPNSSFSLIKTCAVYYRRAQNAFYLTNDTGSFLAPATPGLAGNPANSQCSINAAASSASISGNQLTLTLAVTFMPVFSGNKNIYMSAVSSQGIVSPWTAEGSWIVR